MAEHRKIITQFLDAGTLKFAEPSIATPRYFLVTTASTDKVRFWLEGAKKGQVAYADLKGKFLSSEPVIAGVAPRSEMILWGAVPATLKQ